jgi:hypothetical protein
MKRETAQEIAGILSSQQHHVLLVKTIVYIPGTPGQYFDLQTGDKYELHKVEEPTS